MKIIKIREKEKIVIKLCFNKLIPTLSRCDDERCGQMENENGIKRKHGNRREMNYYIHNMSERACRNNFSLAEYIGSVHWNN